MCSLFQKHVCITFLIDSPVLSSHSRPHMDIRNPPCLKIWDKGLRVCRIHPDLVPDCPNSLTSVVRTNFLIWIHNSGKWSVWKCDWIAWSTCHRHSSMWVCGNTVSTAEIWAWSQSVMKYIGQTAGLQTRTKLRKYVNVSCCVLDDSIQATGTPVRSKINRKS